MKSYSRAYKELYPKNFCRRAVVFDYNSKFIQGLENTLLNYNSRHQDAAYAISFYKSDGCEYESDAGKSDFIIHSGGEGLPVKEDMPGVPKLYICHSHQWKAKKQGGKITRLALTYKEIRYIDVLKSNRIFGRKRKVPIMKYHCLAVTKAPANANVLAISKAIDYKGKQTNVIEALIYDNNSIGIQGHPEEGTAFYLICNFLQYIYQSKD